ncbi:MAG: Flp pilus assembly protein CpaB [Planctomycetaceae bacterium]
MKLTPWLLSVAAFAVICVLAVTYLFQKLMAQEVVEVPPVPARTFPMAITEIEPGTMITMKHIGNGPVGPDEKLAADTIKSLDSLVGRIAKEQIPSAVPLQGSMFYAIGDYPSLQIEDGKRGVTINVDDATAILSGMIKTGQYVDVHMTTDAGASNRLQSTGGSVVSGRTGMTTTLFKGVKVVAMNRGGSSSALQGGGSSHNVTLELDEKQALYMLLAEQKGQIALTYNPTGAGPGGVNVKTESDRVTMEQLLGMTDEPAEKKPFKTEQYRGAGQSSSYWRDGERIEYQGGGNDSDGTSLQSTGGSGGGFQTNAAPADSKNLTQQKQPAVSGTL